MTARITAPCARCYGRGWIQEIVMRLDDVDPGEPQTATVIEVKDRAFCPECGGSGKRNETED